MSKLERRDFIKMSATMGFSATMWEPLLKKALAVEANNVKRSIEDVEHIVILMQENRSFDHYFGAMKGVRGFGDRFPVPLESGLRAFHQSDGEKVVPPYRANGKETNAAFVNGTPHNFPDTQAAWNQGKYGYWPLFKTPYSMAYYTREEIPFQYAMAEHFTICDAYHCSVATGTDPNRIVFWSGSVCDPEKRDAGINCTDEDGEPVNLRCWIKGHMPDPGYTYQGNALKWPTIPDVLQEAGVSWRIYQDPNDNWTGAMHGCLAFESFREAKPGSPIYENGMTHWSLADLAEDVKNDRLPKVSWVLPSQSNSEHPGAPSSPYRASNFTHEVLSAITSNPEVWSKTVFFLTFDENDGLFDHIPAPAVPSYNLDNTLAGKSTINVSGMYFDNDKDDLSDVGSPRKYIDSRDTISGKLRPWGMGPRVPMYILSPWSKGGWVHSEVADHTSVGQFLEKRFGLTIPGISAWHRAVSSDLTSAFNFVTPNDPQMPSMPDTSDFAEMDAASKKLPKAVAPEEPAQLFQEKGSRPSRALPYRLYCTPYQETDRSIRLVFENKGEKGAVYHVYDKKRLDKIPRRYTVESGKKLSDEWTAEDSDGDYDLEVFGPNGFFQSFQGRFKRTEPQLRLKYDHNKGGLTVILKNQGDEKEELYFQENAYGTLSQKTVKLKPHEEQHIFFGLEKSNCWYDFTIKGSEGFSARFAGRIETGQHGISDPAMAMHLE
ncbi:phospholipase C, phosphocholine-specific [Marinilongibacter aquaticus]|uniref:phosphocholine-specific phospholipase C n=1 Tax=Marinilongibacter aquaticus TaxID=2975157 RepID=UPI0021BD624C|nr:phospholipase C, phosphocholine-specific [Marinilongibacter aquaticus]UBM58278.1 phospholipase C, phosphocholine-specific [Marinilongibacter aquaticus]